MLELEILKNRKKSHYYKKASQRMTHDQISELAKSAILSENMEAIMGLAQSNQFAVSSMLATMEGMEFLTRHAHDAPEDANVPRLYLLIHRAAPPRFKRIFRRLARTTIIRTSLKIAGRGLRGTVPARAPYHPGMPEFDLPATLYNYLQACRFLTYREIVGVVRRKKKKHGVLVLDTSGSMFGDSLLNAALTTAVLSYALRDDNFAIVVYNDRAAVLKAVDETGKSIDWIVDQVLDSEAAGFTNITLGLTHGLRELRKIRQPDKFGVLITDGAYNRGGSPLEVAREYPKLHVIGLPNTEPHLNGEQTCRDIARVTNSKYIPVETYHAIPRILLDLLYKL